VTWVAWIAVALGAVANAAAIVVLYLGARSPTPEGVRRLAYVCAVLTGLIVVLAASSLVALVPWDVVGGAAPLDPEDLASRVTLIVQVTLGLLGLLWLPALGAIVLWSRARKLEARADLVEPSPWK
jgi:4-amino-4-deoxy-L-arabinose transferase-like glycosyltransferase